MAGGLPIAVVGGGAPLGGVPAPLGGAPVPGPPPVPGGPIPGGPIPAGPIAPPAGVVIPIGMPAVAAPATLNVDDDIWGQNDPTFLTVWDNGLRAARTAGVPYNGHAPAALTRLINLVNVRQGQLGQRPAYIAALNGGPGGAGFGFLATAHHADIALAFRYLMTHPTEYAPPGAVAGAHNIVAQMGPPVLVGPPPPPGPPGPLTPVGGGPHAATIAQIWEAQFVSLYARLANNPALAVPASPAQICNLLNPLTIPPAPAAPPLPRAGDFDRVSRTNYPINFITGAAGTVGTLWAGALGAGAAPPALAVAGMTFANLHAALHPAAPGVGYMYGLAHCEEILAFAIRMRHVVIKHDHNFDPAVPTAAPGTGRSYHFYDIITRTRIPGVCLHNHNPAFNVYGRYHLKPQDGPGHPGGWGVAGDPRLLDAINEALDLPGPTHWWNAPPGPARTVQTHFYARTLHGRPGMPKDIGTRL